MPDGFMYYYGNVNNSSSNVANYYLPLVATNKIVHKRVVCDGVAPHDYHAVNLYANLDGDIIARQDASEQSQIRLTDNPNFQFGVNDGKLQISLLHGVFDLYGMNNDGFTVWYAVDNTPVSYEFDADGRVVSMSRLSTLVIS